MLGLTLLAGAGVVTFVYLPAWVEREGQPTAAVSAAVPPLPRPVEVGLRLKVPTKSTAIGSVSDPDEGPKSPSSEALPAGDPALVDSPPAAPERRPALSSVAEEDPAEKAFGRAMTSGLSALERGELVVARQAFEQAKTARPQSPLPADGLRRTAEAERLREILALRERAEEQEDGEEWRAAAASYEAVLKLGSSPAFAVEGLRRARGRARLTEQLGAYLARPHRLSADEVLDEAKGFLQAALEIESAGSELLALRGELSALVVAYSRQVSATLESDGQTEIVVYEVGRLGSFVSRTIELRPGVYTVVGSRKGYRDVRRELEIHPGETPTPLLVKCEERI